MNQQSGGTKKTLRVGILSTISTLDPRESPDTLSGLILAQVFQPPYVVPYANANPEPVLFSERLRSEPSVPSGLAYSAAIRPGIVFSDGTPLTAEIAAASLEKTQLISDKAATEARGDRVFFTLKTPNPKFELLLTQTYCGVVLEKAGQLLGSGPFILDPLITPASLATAFSVRLLRNSAFARPVPLDAIEFIIYKNNPAALLEAVGADQIDFTTGLSPADAAKLATTSLKVSIQAGNSTGILFFNTEAAALRDRAVRRAIATTIDRYEIAKICFPERPLAFTARGPLPPLMGRGTEILKFSAADAKRLLAELGPAKPQRLSLAVPWSPRPYAPEPVAMGEEIRRQLAAHGIAIEIQQPKTPDDFFRILARGASDLVLAGWIPDTPDPADFFESLLSSRMIPTLAQPGSWSNNPSRFRSNEMDRALDLFRTNPSDEASAAIHKLLNEEAPFVPLVYGPDVVVQSRRVKNFRVAAAGAHSFERVDLGD